MISISPITKRRLYQFKRNRRGFFSLWIFSAIFILSLFSELLANDRPLLVHYNNELFFPALISYPETTFGGDFATEADYRDPYVQKLIREKGQGFIIFAPIRYRYDTINDQLQSPAPTAPDAENWLGTDDQGRDVLARILYGIRISVLFGLSLTLLTSIIGILAGAIQGYFGGKIDLWFQRFIEIWSGLPMLFMLMILASLVTPNLGWLLLIMTLFGWTNLVGVVRAEFLKARSLDYVRAARTLGVKEKNLVLRHILPNALTATVTFLPFILTGAITTLTSLDFLGFGLPAGDPSLGELLAQGKNNVQAPWLGISGFLVLALLLSLLIFIGEALRDALDPRK
jgi:microcin C transport system permease protein